MDRTKSGLRCALLTFLLSSTAIAEENYSPYVGVDYPKNVYFGDLHLHTQLSLDAYSWGNRLSSDDAYRFAKGEEVTASNGVRAKLSRPLDFLSVTDHASNMGVVADLETQNDRLLKTKEGQRLLKLVQDGRKKSGNPDAMVWKFFNPFTDGVTDEGYRQSVWNSVIQYAERHNDPGKFTAFIGFEWTAMYDKTATHRVVIFKDEADKAAQILPLSNIETNDPEKLWAYLASYEEKTGGHVIAIPHNGNYSHGKMFAPARRYGASFDTAYAKLRSRWEPLYETTQIKGDTETHPILSATDEFADYETWTGGIANGTVKLPEELYQYEYARSALKLGLGHQSQLGVNPFKYGLIGSTDSHTALSSAMDDNFFGKFSVVEPHAKRLGPIYASIPNSKLGAVMNAAGYAAVWAEENTREALFAAMKRRETYATTGPRMTVRFFGGWDYEAEDANQPDLAKIGYAGGVPMGSDLTAAPKGKAPSFLIRAVKDPDGANLDRAQVIKGWRSADGELHEKIYNVALSGGRKDKGNKTKTVGSTVDIKDASYTNTIGDAELATVWTDPNFKADELAFYYVRVLEIPTPRWTAYDAKYFGLKDIPDEVPMSTQERAYTSPIWYTP